MTSPNRSKTVSPVHASLGAELQSFGGHLECMTCGHKQALGNVAGKLEHGWPKHCGYTMRWITARQGG